MEEMAGGSHGVPWWVAMVRVWCLVVVEEPDLQQVLEGGWFSPTHKF